MKELAKCYVLVKGFDREMKRVKTNELFHSFEEIKPYVSGVKKKECGFKVEYRVFPSPKHAQSFLHSIIGKGQDQKKKQPINKVAKKEEVISKDKNNSSIKNEEKKTKDVFMTSFLQTPLVKQISEEFTHIYVDGSYDHHKKIGGGGIVFVKNDFILIRDFIRCTTDTTKDLSSVGMERLTVKRAIELAIANSYTKVMIHYDFNGIVDCLNKDYKTTDVGINNYKRMIEIYSNWVEIQFQKEQAHSGNGFHELADQLAKFAIRVF